MDPERRQTAYSFTANAVLLCGEKSGFWAYLVL
jgi:hypothetical protein